MQTATNTAAAAPNPLLVLLDIVASPLLLFNADAQVVFSNQAAKAMRCRPALLLGSDPFVRALVKDIAAGRPVVSDSLQVEAMSDDGIARLVCRSAPKPIAGLVALAVSLQEDPPPPFAPSDLDATAALPPDQRLSLQQIMELLKDELLPPIQLVIEETRPSTHPALARSVRELHDRLERIVDLVNVFGEDVLIGEDRILVADMVKAICQELAPMTQDLGVSFVIEGDREDLPPVYGSARLIRRALHECLHNAVQHSRQGASPKVPVAVGVTFRASGNHLLISLRNIGALSAAALSRHAATIFRPEASAAVVPPNASESLRIGLPLTQRILQLHGGQLRIENDSAEELDVMLELPTGAPLRNTHHLDMLQAQIYAEDLSKLMARTRKRSTA